MTHGSRPDGNEGSRMTRDGLRFGIVSLCVYAVWFLGWSMGVVPVLGPGLFVGLGLAIAGFSRSRAGSRSCPDVRLARCARIACIAGLAIGAVAALVYASCIVLLLSWILCVFGVVS